jgi:amino acid permease
MYQPNIPAIYSELRPKTISNMKSVLNISNTTVVIVYSLVGFFGYATFSTNPDIVSIMSTANILTGPYLNNSWIIACQFMLLIGIILATPICVLPCKDTIEELWMGQERKMSDA